MQTTVVGSYPKIPNRPRPARLRNAINKRDRGELGDEELDKIRDEVTIEVINEQIEAGIDGAFELRHTLRSDERLFETRQARAERAEAGQLMARFEERLMDVEDFLEKHGWRRLRRCSL